MRNIFEFCLSISCLVTIWANPIDVFIDNNFLLDFALIITKWLIDKQKNSKGFEQKGLAIGFKRQT